jgi:hypothetical protein
MARRLTQVYEPVRKELYVSPQPLAVLHQLRHSKIDGPHELSHWQPSLEHSLARALSAATRMAKTASRTVLKLKESIACVV